MIIHLLNEHNLDKMMNKIPIPLIPESPNINNLIYALNYKIHPMYKDNYFNDILNLLDVKDSKKYFDEFFHYIFHSDTVKDYYIKCENWEKYVIKDKNEIFNGETFKRFYERIFYVPLSEGKNAFTDCTLITIVNSNPRKIEGRGKILLRKLVIFIKN